MIKRISQYSKTLSFFGSYLAQRIVLITEGTATVYKPVYSAANFKPFIYAHPPSPNRPPSYYLFYYYYYIFIYLLIFLGGTNGLRYEKTRKEITSQTD